MTAYGVEFDFDPLLLAAHEWLRPTLATIPLAPCIRTAARIANGLNVYDRGYKLSDMMTRYAVPREGDAHAALSDAIGAARLIPHVLDLATVEFEPLPIARPVPVPFPRSAHAP